ncbi:MAG TPA: hypothetical protein VGZ25_06315 [Gemmataceae bacterium]|jgi:hypothetical protein|nr:hypothetical protein [Gemmataceae bacterium]
MKSNSKPKVTIKRPVPPDAKGKMVRDSRGKAKVLDGWFAKMMRERGYA